MLLHFSEAWAYITDTFSLGVGECKHKTCTEVDGQIQHAAGLRCVSEILCRLRSPWCGVCQLPEDHLLLEVSERDALAAL